MFQSVIGRAQSVNQNTIDVTVNRALVGLSFMVAAGLVAVAIAHRLTVLYGLEAALLALAALFAVFGLIAASVLNTAEPEVESGVQSATEAGTQATTATGLLDALSESDREVLLGVVTAAMPMLAPRLIGVLLRNIPALLVIALVVFAIARQSSGTSGDAGGSAAQPANSV